MCAWVDDCVCAWVDDVCVHGWMMCLCVWMIVWVDDVSVCMGG